MTTSLEWLFAELLARLAKPNRGRLRGDHGEGVISTAIAVLIIAFLGAAMWVGFQKMWQKTEDRTNTQVEQIGSE
jgi:hypothetical protein